MLISRINFITILVIFSILLGEILTEYITPNQEVLKIKTKKLKYFSIFTIFIYRVKIEIKINCILN